MEVNDSIIKGIFYDFDGVITTEKNGSPTIISYISKYSGIPFEIVDKAYRKYNDSLLAGDITHKEMWPSFCDSIQQEIPYDILEDAFLNIKLDSKVVDIIKEQKKNYLIGMITDNKADRIMSILKHTELKDLFDVVIISANVKCRKAATGIFEEALSKAGLAASECVFIDNTLINLDAPKKMGFKTIFFDDEIRDYSLLNI